MYKTQGRYGSTLLAFWRCYACDELMGKARVSRIVTLFFVALSFALLI